VAFAIAFAAAFEAALAVANNICFLIDLRDLLHGYFFAILKDQRNT
jgi:hypothetical protein